jgi:hypothetical protein
MHTVGPTLQVRTRRSSSLAGFPLMSLTRNAEPTLASNSQLFMSIRTGKVLLAAALLLVFLQEAFNMWSETRSTSSFVTALVVTILLCGLLLRSAFRQRDPMVAPSKGWKIFWNVIGVLCALSIIGNVLGLGKPKEHFVSVGGLHIPIDGCVKGAARMFEDKSERIAFCTCMATKLASNSDVVKTYKRDLEAGRMDQVAEALQGSSTFDVSELASCMSQTPGVRWTDVMLFRVKSDCITRMKSDGSDSVYDVEKLCDCLTNEVSQHSPSFLMDTSQDSVLALTKIQEDCKALSRK